MTDRCPQGGSWDPVGKWAARSRRAPEGGPMSDSVIVVAGGGGFIGGHLVADLLRKGHRVRAVDVKPFDEWYQRFDDAHNLERDLSLRETCIEAVEGAERVYQLAADMGGM